MANDADVVAIADAALAWSNPEFEPRLRAIDATLQLDNTFTREAIEFAVDQQMSELTSDRMNAWIDGRVAGSDGEVALLCAGNLPLVELQDWVAIMLAGRRCACVLSSRSTRLLPAFAETAGLLTRTRFVSLTEAISQSELLIGTGSSDTMEEVRRQAAAGGMQKGSLLLRGTGFSVAVVDGTESEEAWIELAEDCLLHEGRGCRNVSVIWAPKGLGPDRFLNAAALVRSPDVFPAHPSTAGALRIPKALLEALGTPCAYADDLSFLVSLGEPDVRAEPCHIRWSEYDGISEVATWVAGQGRSLQLVATNSKVVAQALPEGVLVVRLGQCQRPELSWMPDGRDTVAFLTRGYDDVSA